MGLYTEGSLYGAGGGLYPEVYVNKFSCSGAEQNDDELEDSISVVRHSSLLLIMKWGGELTPFGREQAVEMGKACRFLLYILKPIVSIWSLVVAGTTSG
jgi:hypothetical protein